MSAFGQKQSSGARGARCSRSHGRWLMVVTPAAVREYPIELVSAWFKRKKPAKPAF
jgi:hypothetical protein